MINPTEAIAHLRELVEIQQADDCDMSGYLMSVRVIEGALAQQSRTGKAVAWWVDYDPVTCDVFIDKSVADKYAERGCKVTPLQPVTSAQEGGEACITLLARTEDNDDDDPGPFMSARDWLRLRKLPGGAKLYTHPSASVPDESRPLPANRYGVDRDYFTKNLEILIRDMRDYTPSELARSLGRLAMTANSETMREPEFNIGDLSNEPKYRDSATTPQPATGGLPGDLAAALYAAVQSGKLNEADVINQNGRKQEIGELLDRAEAFLAATPQPADKPAPWRLAMKRLVFAARTSGGTAGADEELQNACSACESLMNDYPEEDPAHD